jgi:hypothetical protein
MEAEEDVMRDWGPSDRLAVTISVWESVEDLDHFVHQTVHGAFLERREEWFEAADGMTYVIWPIDRDHRPSVEEAADRYALYRANGPSAEAFDFSHAKGYA